MHGRSQVEWTPGQPTTARRLRGWARLQRALQAGLSATTTAWRIPAVTVDETEMRWLAEQAARSAALERSTADLERQLVARDILDARTDDPHLRACAGARLDLVDMPLDADGELHDIAARAMVEVAIWAQRFQDLEPTAQGG